MARRNGSSFPEFEGMPLSPAHAAKLWPRSAIARYAFPQPPSCGCASGRKPAPSSRARPRRACPPPATSPSSPRARRTRRRRLRAGGHSVNPLFVYPPDGRHTFNDTTYPWRACGRVVTAVGHGAGTIVGPQHVLTASHVVDWSQSNGQIGWLRFEPDLQQRRRLRAVDGDHHLQLRADRRSPGRVRRRRGLRGPRHGSPHRRRARMARHQDLRRQLGWRRLRGPCWAIPTTSAAAARRPSREASTCPTPRAPGFLETGSGRDIETFASLNHGNSGGPTCSASGPTAPMSWASSAARGRWIPVYSDLTSRTGNWVAGGSPMPDLVNQARSDHP